VNYKKGKEIDREGAEGEKVKKYFFYFSLSFCALFAFAVNFLDSIFMVI
jgi:hypothetical protein